MSPPNPELGEYLDGLRESGGWASTTLLAGRPFHLHYESALLKAVFLADMPALIFCVALGLMMFPFSLLLGEPPAFVGSYIAAAVLLVAASLQWLLVGYWIQRGLRRSPPHRGGSRL